MGVLAEQETKKLETAELLNVGMIGGFQLTANVLWIQKYDSFILEYIFRFTSVTFIIQDIWAM